MPTGSAQMFEEMKQREIRMNAYYEAGKMVGPAGGTSKPRLISEGGEPVPSPLAAVDSTSSPESCRGEPSPKDQ